MKYRYSLVALAAATASLSAHADLLPVMSNSKIQLYGFVRLDTTLDLAGSNGDAGDWGGFLMTQPIDGSALANKHGDTYLTARTSRLGVKGTLGDSDIGFKLEGDFNGTTAEASRPGQAGTNSTGFRVRQAYLEGNGWLVGQSWSNFEDFESVPEAVQWNPPLTAAAPRQPQVRYTFDLGSGSSAAFALEHTYSETFSGKDFDTGYDLTGRVTYHGSWGHIALRAVAEPYHTNDGTTKQSTVGYAAGLSGSVNAGSGKFIYGLFAGDGAGRYLWGSVIEGAIATPTGISKFKSKAFHVGYTQNWSSSVRSNVSYARMTFDNNPNAIPNLQNKSLSQLFVNTFFGVAKNTEIGLEYTAGRRKVMNPVVDATANPLGNSTGRESRVLAEITASF